MILGDLYQQSRKRVDSLDARLLICHALGLSQEQFLLQKERPLCEEEKAAIEALVAQREKGRPVAKIIGKKEFYGREFTTTEDTLDPRPDSETLIEAVLKNTDPQKPFRMLDLGTGTGCLILTLLAERPLASGIAVDVSDKALAVAKKNAVKIGVEDRVVFIESDWFAEVVGMFDVVLSNPPYIPSGAVASLDRDVRDFDPHGALDGGADGLDPYRVILAGIKNHLKPEGMLAFEVGHDQAETVAQMLEDSGFERVSRHLDLGGINRIVTGFRLK